MPNVIRLQSSYEEPYPVQVQGESHYRRNLEDVSNYLGDDEGVSADDFIARLILEDNNLYDENAVRVEIDGKKVGYLSRPAAKKYRARLAQLGLTDAIGECYASIKGGFIRKDGEQADFGVRLDFDLDTFDVEKPRPAPVATVAPEPVATPAPISSQAKNISPETKKTRMNPVLKVIGIIVLIVIACFCGLFIYGLYLQAVG